MRLPPVASRARQAFVRLANLCRKPLGITILFALSAGLIGIYGGWPSLQLVSLAVLSVAVLHTYGVAVNAHDRAVGRGKERGARSVTAPRPSTRPESSGKSEAKERITVVIPLYNEARFIADCLDSLLSQTHADWIAIVVDDASTDDGPKIAAEYAAKDERIKLARHLVNSGLSAARNTGLRLAQTRLVAFLDSDDMLLPESLAGRLAALGPWLEDPEVAGVYSGIVSVPEEAGPDFEIPRRTAWDEFQDLVTAGADCPFNAHAPLLKTELLRNIGGFDESMKNGGEDWDLWQRLMRHGYYFRSAKLIGGLYRRKRNSMVRTLSTAHLEVATSLYRRVREPLTVALADSQVPVLDRPLQDYLEAVQLSARVIGFAAMSFIEHGQPGLERHLAFLPDAAGPYLLRHLDLASIIEQGLKRGLAFTGPVPESQRAEFDLMAETVETEVLEALRSRNSQPTVPPQLIASIYLAGDAYEAQQVLKHVAENDISHSEALVLDPATVNGEQGVAGVLEGTGLRRCSVNEFVFGRPVAPRIVCFRAYGYGVDLLRAHAELTDSAFEVAEVAAPTTPDPEALPEELTQKKKHSWEDLASDRSYGITVLVKEELFARMPDVEKLERFRDRHVGERCVIVGNGPSLNEMDLSLLENEHTIAVNGIFYKTTESGFRPEYYVVEDSSVMKENIDAIIAYEVPYKFFPTHYQSLHPADENVAFFRMNRGFYEQSGPNYCIPRFSTDFARRAFCGQSVTYINLQLAYFMGFSDVYLIGMDFSYHIPDSAIRDGDLITSTEDDPNHFNGAYFGAGKTWKDPKLDRVLQNYKSAKRMYEADGRRILNATAGGKLELFERVDYQATFSA